MNEVVLSVQFDEPAIDDAFALTEFWPQVRAEFPGFEKQPPILPAREEFGVPPSPERLAFSLLTEQPGQRYWLLSDDQTRLLQLQSDRFVLNWRQVEPDNAYPRYRELRADFRRLYGLLLSALGPDRGDRAVAALCEISYVNHIEARSPTHPEYHASLAEILNVVNSVPGDVAGEPEDTQFQQRYRIPDGKGEPIGRFYISVAPAYRRTDEMPIYSMTLLARGRPDTGSLDGVIAFFDRGRSLVVREFAALTTEGMHRKWRMEPHDRAR